MKARREGPDYHNRTLIHSPPHDHKILVFSCNTFRLRCFLFLFDLKGLDLKLTDSRQYQAIFDN